MSAGFTPRTLAERIRNEIAAINELNKDGNVTLLWDCLEAIEEADDALTSLLSWARSGDIDGSASVLKAERVLAKARGEQSNA